MRKTLFPPHKYLEHVGLLSPLEAPHHFKINDEWEFREGVVTDIPCKENKGSWIDIGLRNVLTYLFICLYSAIIIIYELIFMILENSS